MQFKPFFARLTAVAVLLVIGARAHAGTINVSNLNDDGAGSLRQAIASANAGDTVSLSGVTGTIALTTDELSISKGIKIIGPGADKVTVSGNHALRVFYTNAANVAISGLRIADGHESIGSALYIEGSGASVTISNCVLDSNSSDNGGGGIFNDQAKLNVVGCTFTNNSTDSGGGAIFNSFGALSVQGSTFASNVATYSGAAIHNCANSGTASINGCTFSSNYQISTNTGYALGGDALFNESGNMTVDNSTFNSNVGFDCGAIYNYNGGKLNVTRSTFTGNSATGRSFGGAIFSGNNTGYSPSLSVEGCTFAGNSGTAVRVSAGAALIRSNTFTRNSATDYGGALYFSNATVALYNNTISGNSATKNGGGVYNNNATVNVRDCLIALNTVESGGQGPDVSGVFNSQNYNLFSDVTGATINGTKTHNIISSAPKLGDLADNGGPTQTMALLSGSPAIDKGFSGGIAIDQRGFTRIADNASIVNAVGGDGSDIGAFEMQGSAAKPSLSVSDVAQNEGDATNTISFTVTLSSIASGTVNVDYATSDGTAKAGSDYTAKSGTLSIPGGRTSATISIPVLGDKTIEPGETFFVSLKNSSGATIFASQATATLVNDDAPAPGVTLSGRVVGYVLGSNGKVAVVGYPNVLVARFGEDDSAVTTRTDKNGLFKWNAVPAGTYLVTAIKSGVSFDASATSVTLGTKSVSNLLFKTYMIYGVVTQKIGSRTTPDAGATSVVNGVVRAQSNAKGIYSLAGLTPGTYNVAAQKSGLTFPAARALVVSSAKPAVRSDIAAIIVKNARSSEASPSDSEPETGAASETKPTAPPTSSNPSGSSS